jgi:5,6-dimethylbenzimidazole synthase
MSDLAFSADEREAVYRAIFERRDCRHFVSGDLPDELLGRLLLAAHHAPSVGFMQPWNFVVIRSMEVRSRIKAAFERSNREALDRFEGVRGEAYRALKLEGICESALNLCITCDRSRNGPIVLGRTAQPEMDLYSTVCAVQNLWLAARAEGVGVGWVSIIDPADLREILDLPEPVVPVAYLCLGRVETFPATPELQRLGWLDRIDLRPLVFEDRWGQRPGSLD